MRQLCFALIILFLTSPVGAAEVKTILFLGDSLTAGYGVRKEQSYPSLLEKRWLALGHQVQVINGAESGSLSSSLADRLDFYLKRFKPNLIVIASGGNDARQLTPPEKIEANLRLSLRKAKTSQAKVALVAMRIFPNLGKEYTEAFQALYPRLAKAEKVALIPFFLSAVAGDRKFNQADGFHPNVAGHEKIAEQMAPELEKLISW